METSQQKTDAQNTDVQSAPAHTHKPHTDKASTEQFSNDQIQVAITRHPGCMAQVEVTLDAAATKDAHDTAVKDVRKEVSIPGFRKGKVPEEVVRKNFASAIDRQFRDTLLQNAFSQALELSKLRPFSRNAVKRSELKKADLATGATCLFLVETEPTIPAIDINTIETRAQQAREVTSEHMQRAFKQLRVMHAQWQDITDRPVELGDFVEVDIDVIEHPAHNVCTNQLVHVEKSELPAWLLNALLGMNVDETKEALTTNLPDDPRHLFVQEENAPAKQCLVVVKAIKTATLPTEDQAFAEKFGAKSIEELTERVSKQMKEEEEHYAQEVSRYNLRRELLQKYPLDLPHSLIEAEVRARVAFCKSGADLAQGSLPTDQKDADLRHQIEAETRGFFAWMHLLRPITAKLQNSTNQELLQNEFQAEFQQQMKLPRPHRLIYPGLDPEDVRNRLFMLIMMRKCEDHLLEQVSGKTAIEDKTV